MTANQHPPNDDHDPRIPYFDALADQWDHRETVGGSPQERLENLRDLLNLAPGHDLLEVGCGTGALTPWLARQVAPGNVTAVDASPAMIARAETKEINARFACMDACRDDFQPAAFDVIFCFHVFPHFRDQPAALRRLARALKTKGRLIVMHLAGSAHINAFHAGLDAPVKHDRLPQGREWDDLLTPVGLRRKNLIDHETLFFLQAEKPPAPPA